MVGSVLPIISGSMLIYLSTKDEARDILDQRQLSEYTSEDGLHLLWRLLEEAYGESTAEHFERAERELSGYRRIPGQTVASYVATMKRLKAQYIITDPETVISDRSWAKRLLNRALLNRRERLDVFYSAGGDMFRMPSRRPYAIVALTFMRRSAAFLAANRLARRGA